ncbi:MAG: nitrogen fixation protein NifX [Nitrospirae bacterium]|nr:nitrogen fixation protein NifX [Nitrospirota bacterium]
MKIAFATTGGLTVDEHFGRAGKFAVYEIKYDGCEFVESRTFSEEDTAEIQDSRYDGQLHIDKVEVKVQLLCDCKIIYFTQIGGPAAARLVKKSVMPMKVDEGSVITELIERLQETINNSPAPWLKKALMGGSVQPQTEVN